MYAFDYVLEPCIKMWWFLKVFFFFGYFFLVKNHLTFVTKFCFWQPWEIGNRIFLLAKLFFWQNVKIRQWFYFYLFIYLFICGGECSPLWESYFEKGIFCHKYPVLWGKKKSKKKGKRYFIFKIAKNRHNLPTVWMNGWWLRFFYFHILNIARFG